MSEIRTGEEVVFDFCGPKVHGDSLYGFMPDGALVRRSNYLGDWIEVDYSELTVNQLKELVEELGEQVVREKKEQSEREANQTKVSLRGVWEKEFFLGLVIVGEESEHIGDSTFEECVDMTELLKNNNEVLVSFVHDEGQAARSDKALGG